MKIFRLSLPLTFLLLFLLVPTRILAHPGNTNSNGCHVCRTNCDKWGEEWNVQHCHGGGTSTTTTYTAPVPTATPTPKPTATPKPTSTPYPTATPTPKVTSVPSPTPTPSEEPTSTPIPTNTPTPEPEVMAASIENDTEESDSPLVNTIAGLIVFAIFATPVYVGHRGVKFLKKR